MVFTSHMKLGLLARLLVSALMTARPRARHHLAGEQRHAGGEGSSA